MLIVLEKGIGTFVSSPPHPRSNVGVKELVELLVLDQLITEEMVLEKWGIIFLLLNWEMEDMDWIFLVVNISIVFFLMTSQ